MTVYLVMGQMSVTHSSLYYLISTATIRSMRTPSTIFLSVKKSSPAATAVIAAATTSYFSLQAFLINY